MGNLKKRLERLEAVQKGRGVSILIVYPGENKEEVLKKYPRHDGEVLIILDISSAGQAPSCAPPPPRPKPQESPKATGPAPLQISK